MFELKLQYLNEENLSLKRQVRDLKNILSIQSPENHKSVLYQLHESNLALSQEIQQIKDQLLLQRSAREIQRTDHSEVVEQLNRCIFNLKEQITLLEDILKREHKTEVETNVIHRLFRKDNEKENNQLLHEYADPVMFFEVLQGLLAFIESSQSFQGFQETEQSGNKIQEISDPFETSSNRLITSKNSSMLDARNSQKVLGRDRTMSRWHQERSSIYFLRKNRKQDLHLCLQKAKTLQQQSVKADEKQQKTKRTLTTNVDLLKKSYVQLIGEYQILKRKYRALSLYVQELQHRNQLLINSRIGRLS